MKNEIGSPGLTNDMTNPGQFLLVYNSLHSPPRAGFFTPGVTSPATIGDISYCQFRYNGMRPQLPGPGALINYESEKCPKYCLLQKSHQCQTNPTEPNTRPVGCDL